MDTVGAPDDFVEHQRPYRTFLGVYACLLALMPLAFLPVAVMEGAWLAAAVTMLVVAFFLWLGVFRSLTLTVDQDALQIRLGRRTIQFTSDDILEVHMEQHPSRLDRLLMRSGQGHTSLRRPFWYAMGPKVSVAVTLSPARKSMSVLGGLRNWPRRLGGCWMALGDAAGGSCAPMRETSTPLRLLGQCRG